MNDTGNMPYFNPLEQTMVQITYEDILNNFSDAFIDKLFFFWVLFFGYVFINTYRFKLFKNNPEVMDLWEDHSHGIVLIISIFYPLVYLYYGVY